NPEGATRDLRTFSRPKQPSGDSPPLSLSWLVPLQSRRGESPILCGVDLEGLPPPSLRACEFLASVRGLLPAQSGSIGLQSFANPVRDEKAPRRRDRFLWQTISIASYRT